MAGHPRPGRCGTARHLRLRPDLWASDVDNLHYWLGDGLSAGRKRLESWFPGLGDRLVAVDVEGTLAYVAREDVDALGDTHPSRAARFLPGHDQWVMGPGTKDTHVTPSTRRDLMTRKANPVIVDGVVCGTWARKGEEITVTWLDERRRPDQAIEREAGRLAGILDRDLRLRLASCRPPPATRCRAGRGGERGLGAPPASPRGCRRGRRRAAAARRSWPALSAAATAPMNASPAPVESTTLHLVSLDDLHAVGIPPPRPLPRRR